MVGMAAVAFARRIRNRRDIFIRLFCGSVMEISRCNDLNGL